MEAKLLFLIFSYLCSMQRAVKKSLNFLRKSLALILVSVYVLFSVGILKATHFCMGREASVQFFTSESKKCPCSISALEKDSCCDDEHELIRIDDEQKIISTLTAPVPVWKVERLFTHQFVARSIISIAPRVDQFEPDSPPKVPLWKAHQSYVFYDEGSDSDVIA
jgi:hypothetical protein